MHRALPIRFTARDTVAIYNPTWFCRWPCFRLQEYDEAREAFAHGLDIEAAKLPKLDSAYLGPDWFWRDIVIARALKREAEALIEGRSATTGVSVQE